MGYVPLPLPPRYDISYELCKKHNRSTNFTECETCKDKFICWTQKSNRVKEYPANTIVPSRFVIMAKDNGDVV